MSTITRCPLYSMPTLNRFYCIPEKWSQADKAYSTRKICKGVSSNTLLRIQTARIRSKCSKKLGFSGFYYHLKYTWVDLIRSTCLIFLKSPWWPVCTLFVQELLKRIILSNIICMMMYYKKMSVMKHLKKSYDIENLSINNPNLVIIKEFFFI